MKSIKIELPEFLSNLSKSKEDDKIIFDKVNELLKENKEEIVKGITIAISHRDSIEQKISGIVLKSIDSEVRDDSYEYEEIVTIEVDILLHGVKVGSASSTTVFNEYDDPEPEVDIDLSPDLDLKELAIIPEFKSEFGDDDQDYEWAVEYVLTEFMKTACRSR